MSSSPKFEHLLYENPAEHVARIVMNRVDKRNATDTAFIYELNDAFDFAAQDPEVKVIILAANGPHFCSGHDIYEGGGDGGDNVMIGGLHEGRKPVSTSANFGAPGNEGYLAREEELYIQMGERWRELPKPMIAQVHGKCIAGGLSLVWPCDLIVASEDAQFIDNTLLMGAPGIEMFSHPWEFGTRKAKELLFCAQAVTAAEAEALGMVNRVVARDDLESEVLSVACKIAERSSYVLKITKKILNSAEDAKGRRSVQELAFAYHQLAHWHHKDRFGMINDPSYFEKYMKKGQTKAEEAPAQEKQNAG